MRMKQNNRKREHDMKIKKWLPQIEIAAYGMMTLAYGALFFFGALYPDYGIPRQSICYEEEVLKESEASDDLEQDEVQFKCLLWEELKEWF